ncbi:hypothetical protein J5N97_007325 [Dioscorea zingiberensis]|uniref:Uncharacterized protein n=1 Tax=Dioscorea zingiberensis TaxID=325984 RepID=A0A9D5HU47_9LILI|nr:hypothetical protein J5N97_007325 [Dioscorea zingiberensis]
MAGKACPANAFLYNGTLCACNPGRFFLNGSCSLFDAPAGKWGISSDVESTRTFLTTVLPLDSIKRVTQSQALLLEATLVALVSWLLFCVAIRFVRVDNGESSWFRIRWLISRLDFVYATKHWLDDRMVVRKRKTELGGTLSVASWILFVGLLSALLYQLITKRSIEVYRIRPANAPDLLEFVNDMEFNITTISSMSCSHLRGLDTLVTGTSGFIDYRVFPLSTYVNYRCYNTSRGPTISLKCNNCQVPRRDHYISWNFVDLPNEPATAIGFEFSLTAKDHGDDTHVSYVSGTVESSTNDTLKTFRGPDLNILKIHLFPRTYNNLHNLKLIQPLFHEFIPGSSLSEASDLMSSLQSSKSGIVNTTLYVSYLADYIVEIDNEKLNGPVTFLADVGGIYSISVAIFLYLLWQCEARFKKLRSEDSVMRDIRSRRRAQRNWDKLKKYVAYTWGPGNLDCSNISSTQQCNLTMDSSSGVGFLHKTEQNSVPKATERAKSRLAGSTEIQKGSQSPQ